MFLMGVGEQVSTEVLTHLAPRKSAASRPRLAATRLVGSEHAFRFREFEVLTTEGSCQRRSRVRPRWWNARSGGIRSEALAGVPDSRNHGGHFGLLENRPQQLAMFLKKRAPATIAVRVSQRSRRRSLGALLKSLPRRPRPSGIVWPPSIGSRQVFQKVTEAMEASSGVFRRSHRTVAGRPRLAAQSTDCAALNQ